jgi:hypothetical protein
MQVSGSDHSVNTETNPNRSKKLHTDTRVLTYRETGNRVNIDCQYEVDINGALMYDGL